MTQLSAFVQYHGLRDNESLVPTFLMFACRIGSITNLWRYFFFFYSSDLVGTSAKLIIQKSISRTRLSLGHDVAVATITKRQVFLLAFSRKLKLLLILYL
jgi:hypothetical protein